MTDRYAVFGNPIGHSKSPMIHAEFANQTAQDIDYTALEPPIGELAAAWQAFCSEGGRGANVTVPFKADAFVLCDTLSHRARLAGAVNTLILGGNGRTYGDTTDGVGLVRDLAYHRVALAGKRVLIVGAGGAVLAEDFADLGSIKGGGFDSLEGKFDVVINGTSASLSGDLPPLPDGLFANGAWAYDMMYGAEPTVFLQWAGPRGAKLLDGLGMLVEQAAESFYLWRNQRPDTAPIRARLRQSLNYV
ncbi:MAG: shikimate dehydrogenase [Halomonas sp.]|nr:shikimate dehydrogenase [Halomonas sp.]